MDLLSSRLYGLLALCLTLFKDASSKCTFPQFLWHPLANGTDRVWITETEFVGKTNEWESQLEITAKKHTIVAKMKLRARCNDYSGSVPCFKQHTRWEETCLTQHPDGRYTVLFEKSGRSWYKCVKITKLHNNIVQIWTGKDFDDVSETICQGDLQRHPWPWIDSSYDTWSFCPMKGGYDFVTYMYQRRRRLCMKVWRASRMESECITGEGIIFTFPEESCSPFVDSVTDFKLQCVGHWKEHNYLFIVGRHEAKTPQFVMRVPSDYESQEEFSLRMYFRPIALISRKGIPDNSLDIYHFELGVKRGEGGICYDESELCPTHAAKNLCIEHQKYGNYCKRSCGYCGMVTSHSSECRFPQDYMGELHQYTNDRHERVHIYSGSIEFSSLGELVCKKKHWERNQYSLLSWYDNGCRPRYTCIEFGRLLPTTLEYRVSKSSLKDIGFKLCRFEDDITPLSGAIRSSGMKKLIPETVMTQGSCEIHGVMRMEVTLADGRRCTAALSDWDGELCAATRNMQLTLADCRRQDKNKTLDMNNVQAYQEFDCVSYFGSEWAADRFFLITRPQDSSQKFQCWVIETFPQRMSLHPWRSAALLSVAECPVEEHATNYTQHTLLTAYRDTVEVSTPCPRIDKDYNSDRDSRNSKYHKTTRKPPRGGPGRSKNRNPSYLGNTHLQSVKSLASVFYSSFLLSTVLISIGILL